MAKRKLIDGLPVVDATIDAIVTIKPVDIKGAKRKSETGCAAARAICRQEHVEEARVHLSRTLIKRKTKWQRYSTPPCLRTQLALYDKAGIFDAGDYPLKAPPPSQRLGYNSGQKRAPHKKTGKAPRVMHALAGMRDSAPKGGYSEGDDD